MHKKNLQKKKKKKKKIQKKYKKKKKKKKKKKNITKTRLFKYIDNFTIKNWKFSDKKKNIFFSNFCSKYRLWVLVRTASPRRF